MAGADYLRFLLGLGYVAEILHRAGPAERLDGLAPEAVVARIAAAQDEWRAATGGTHLDLCFHPAG